MSTFKCIILIALSLAGCDGTTGGARMSFEAAAAGPSFATGGPLSFTSGSGYQVILTRATLHLGAIYLNQTVPTSGSQETSCILPGTYVAQVLSQVDVDVLSPKLQRFPRSGQGVAQEAKAGELWLSSGDINNLDDRTVIVDAQGTATQGGQSYPFEARITIGRNRQIPTRDPAYPGANPICKQRIVSPIATELTPQEGGTLLLRIDPRGWFDTVDFAQVPKVSDTPLLYRFSDLNDNAADLSLFQNGLRARAGVYSLSWQS